jgi:hypothetical protein
MKTIFYQRKKIRRLWSRIWLKKGRRTPLLDSLRISMLSPCARENPTSTKLVMRIFKEVKGNLVQYSKILITMILNSLPLNMLTYDHHYHHDLLSYYYFKLTIFIVLLYYVSTSSSQFKY